MVGTSVGRAVGMGMWLRGVNAGLVALSFQVENASAQALLETVGAMQASAAIPLPAVNVEAPKQSARPRHQVRHMPARSQRTAREASIPQGMIASDAAQSGAPAVASGAAVAPSMASEIRISGQDVNARPVTRPGEVLEAVPGLVVTQHSGEGKANQYFLRGYNLDHGTDLALSVDDVPVNMRTHAHGQGYADLNWLMPETIGGVDVRKGPYFADEGDIASVGSVHIGLIDSVPKAIAQVTAGSFGYRRFFGMDSARGGDGNLVIAAETARYDGPWTTPG